jgi:EmrB/QacA subfamily drug resistance transporter
MAVTGVMLVIFLFAIDATIVATSMPTIVAQLGGLELYSWVFSVYMLASALTTPVFGKLADLFSRRRLMLIGIGMFLFGSMLCGVARSMEMMVLFRAIQGLGGGAIYALSFIIVGILYPPQMRAKMQGIISSIWGLASILGPLAGGLIVENMSWRWIFFVNLPLVAIASPLIVIGLKEPQRETRSLRLDLAGAVTLLIGLLLLFYALAQSAHAQSPLNGETIGFFTAGLAVLFLFLIIEKRTEEPIIPLELFKIGLFKSSAAVAALCSMGVFGAISYLPLYLQGVLGVAASRAGLVLLFLSLGWTAGSLIAGRWVNRRGYRTVATSGMVLLTLGYGIFLAPRVGLHESYRGRHLHHYAVSHFRRRLRCEPHGHGDAEFHATRTEPLQIQQHNRSSEHLGETRQSPKSPRARHTRADFSGDAAKNDRSVKRRALVCISHRLHSDVRWRSDQPFYARLYAGEYSKAAGKHASETLTCVQPS